MRALLVAGLLLASTPAWADDCPDAYRDAALAHLPWAAFDQPSLNQTNALHDWANKLPDGCAKESYLFWAQYYGDKAVEALAKSQIQATIPVPPGGQP